ncbi:hypothetical protein Q9233_004213 [Columba guinea]|nr:hypothetical protein Q9233_004213 [Columba guinea]
MPVAFALSPAVCLLCRRADTDPELYGLMLEAEGLCAHQYCLFFANELFHRRPSNDGLMGFLPEDILHIVERAEQKDCFVCSESGATITCQETGCNRSFHFPCALEGGCITQFLPHYRSYCWEHCPQQEPQAAPENTTCLICLEPVEDRTSYGTMVCPACQHAWFHRGCIQFFANELFHRRPSNDGLMGFLPEDILHIVERAEQKDCFVCSESGATITCQETGCNRSFHFPCALEGGCITQFLPHYRSYCWEHCPQQEPQAAPENTTCLICLEPVEDRTSYGTMVCPACQHAWFHRGCIQFFANELFHRRPSNDGLMGFLPEDILHIVERAEQKDCFVCSESGATITCQETGCNRSFHFPCALEGGCITQFLPHYRSYCWEHCPQQEPQAAPENTTCLICLEPVEDRTSYGTMVCPACQHAWFHRGCIQVGAVP